VRAHGGKIAVQERAGGGTLVEFTVAARRPSTGIFTGGFSQPMNRSLLLVVEDDAEMRSVVALSLRSYGYQVREAASGADALSQIQTRTPDAMILDLGATRYGRLSWSPPVFVSRTISRS